MRSAHIAARLSVFAQFDAQAAKRNMEKLCGVGAIAVAAYERIENMLSLHFG